MKRKITFILSALLSCALTSSSIAADINTPLFASFEDGQSSPFELNADGPGSEIRTQSIADNPLKEKNKSDKSILINMPANVEWWHKTYLKIETETAIVPASENHKYLHFFVLYPDGGNGAEIGVFNTAGELIYQKDHNFDSSTEWQDIVFDLSTDLGDKAGIIGNNIGGIWIRPFTGGSSACYLDEFELSDSSDPRGNEITWDSPTPLTFEEGDDSPFDYTIDGGVLDSSKDNPNTNTINISDKCIFGDYSEGSDWWHKIKFEAKENYTISPNSDDHKYLHFMSYRDFPAESELQIYDKDGIQLFQKRFSNLSINTWEEIVIDLTQSDHDFPGITGKTIGKIWIMTNVNATSEAQLYYYDSFYLTDSKDPIGEIRNLTELGDFEEGMNQAIKDVVAQTNDAVIEIADNPLAEDKLNETSKVLKFDRPAGAEWWQSLRLFIDGFIGIESPNTYLHFMIYNPSNQKIDIVINNIAGEEFSKEIIPTQSEGWVDYVIDLASFEEMTLNNISAINIRIPEDNEANTYYFDEIIINDNALPREADPTSLTEQDVEMTNIFAKDGYLYIKGNKLVKVEIYNPAGLLLHAKQIQGSDNISLNRGIYIIKVVDTNGNVHYTKVVS